MSEKRNFPGSRWWKFDFHAHTPASHDYGHGDDCFRSVKPEEWLQKAMEKELDCVVVTDHNSGGWIDKLKAKNEDIQGQDAKPEWFRELTIFPGVEITVADSSKRVHLLAVLDPSCGSENVTSLLGDCGINNNFGDDKTTATTTSFIETVRKITEAGGIPISAHIDRKSGLLEGVTSLTPELKKSLNEIFSAEFCDPHKFDQSPPDLKNAVDRLAKLAGSDAHKPDEIGKYSSWLKMGTPSIQGLRLALKDHKFCIKNQSEDPNHPPDIFITKLTIQSMRHCGRIPGRPFTLQIHPHFNAVIGGRGTGKSTILESLRIVARRENELKPFEKLYSELRKFIQDESGPKKDRGVMSDDTEILLEIHRRGKNYRLRWRFDGQGSVLEEQTDRGLQEAETGDIRERFPISIYSQKQINALATDPKGILEIVDRSPEVNHTEWKTRWESAKSQFLQLRERQRELSRQLSEEAQTRAKLQDINNDLREYEEKGHGEILRQYQKRSRQRNSLLSDEIFDRLFANIRELAENSELPDFPIHLFDNEDEAGAEMSSIHEQTSQNLRKVSTSLLELAKTVNQIRDWKNEQIESSQWAESEKSSAEAYDALVKAYEEKKSPLSISFYGDWVQQRNQLQNQLHRLESVRKETETSQREIKEILKKLMELRRELFEKRSAFINQAIGNNPFVQMELVRFGDVSILEDEYRSLLNLDGGKFKSSVCDESEKCGILWHLLNWEELKTPESDLPEIVSNIKSETRNIVNGESSGNHGSFNNRLKKLFREQPAIFDHLDAWWPEDMLRVRYSKDPGSGKFSELETGSAGQKASAILAFLLSHGSEPLIMDQPEDDLDNALIYDLIVTQIHKNKERRQLIIVTHNSNIVVNGDAELAHVLKFQKGQIQLDRQGSLEEPHIRDAVCAIMEGGQEAFDKRYQRIRTEVTYV